MLYDVSALYKNPDLVLDLNEEIPFGEEFSKDAIVFDKPVTVSGNIKNTGGILTLSAKVTGAFRTSCDRCGKEVELPVDFEMVENLAKNVNSEEGEEIILLEKEKFNLFEVVAKNVFSNFPSKKLCSENCAGICQRCGADLNLDKCSCQDDDNWNPQFDILKGLFD